MTARSLKRLERAAMLWKEAKDLRRGAVLCFDAYDRKVDEAELELYRACAAHARRPTSRRKAK